ncbi:hypothetical protein CTA2_5663 [Colletotrichum tanaceti]|uniref:Uncharacterized protein n=1 Tax=Colletotrichum tanaceti TaxID=1306861 RepID=A0A4U6XKX1_9PEZI|nr:hypothetical protein CTA2_5663 [Colletotrichum tanaceti]TKW56280.1 hypothetical protein CTA1_11933 [Colletotrichum tanaceti]
MGPDAIFVPVGVQAFVVTEDFPQSNYRIAPLIQPDYSSLRAEGLLSHDVIDQLQLSRHRLLARHNTRFVNVATGEVRKERVGVYLGWTLPRAYRQGITATETAAADHPVAELKAGYTYNVQGASKTSDEEEEEEAAAANSNIIKFRSIPTRYLIFRIAYSRNSSTPASEIFVLEADRIRNINEAELDNLDVENLTSPFIDPALSAAQQAEAFIGLKKTLRDYTPDPDAPRRVPLTIVESGNDLFADFQPHNVSVLSLHDDLGFGTASEIKDATLNYLIVGFHGQLEHDPLRVADSVKADDLPTYGKLLDACAMDLVDSAPVQGPSRSAWLDAKADATSARVVCHGTLRGVPFRRPGLEFDLEAESPSIQLQDLVRKQHPVAVGTNTLDALLAFLRVRYADDAQGRSRTDQMLSKMVQLIVASDNIDAQEKAEDQIATNDWVPSSSGVVWSVSKPERETDENTASLALTPAEVQALAELNEWEAVVAAMLREKQHLCRRLFFRWWNAMEVRGTALDATQQGHKAAITALLGEIKDLDDALDKALEAASRAKDKVKAERPSTLVLEAVSAPSFGVHRDPTVLFAGVPSGWPTGFADKVKVRLSTQLPATPELQPFSQQLNMPEWSDLVTKHFPEMAPFVRQIAPEALGSGSGSAISPASAYSAEEGFGPGQGWFPLFIEWEVEYHHIPFDSWLFARDADGNWRYRLAELLEPNVSECRTISGRTPITPQASSVLKSRLRQLFARAQTAGEKKEADAGPLVDQVSGIEYFSASLTGIRDHLVTLMQGAHAQPHPDDALARELGLSASDLRHLSAASDRAPYGRLAQVEGHDPVWCGSFRPVTHGQFLFTKLHIVDKFGQIVSCVEPATFDAPRTALYPCVSPHLSCEPKLGSPDSAPWPNTVYDADEQPGLCQLFQVAPRINQDARLNASFVVEAQQVGSGSGSGSEVQYRPITPFENPIWGWIIINNLDKSFQVFNAGGRFVREFCLLPDSNKVATPSPPPEVHRAAAAAAAAAPPGPGPGPGPGLGPTGTASAPGEKRLASLLRNLLSFPYALGMLTMLEEAYQATSSSTAEHADFLPAAFGRAFCLADFGCSIELACPPFENTCTQHPPEGPPMSPLSGYKFPVGLGNAGAGFDGLAGYFDTVGDPDMGDIYSDFGDARDPGSDAPGPRPNPVVRRSGPSLSLDPYHPSGIDGGGGGGGRTAAAYASSHRAALQVRGVILDPMRPLHIYTGGLFPMKEVVLPRWAVGAAMAEMHAFFSAGPLLVPHLPPPNDMRANTAGPAVAAAAAAAADKEPGVEMAVAGLESSSWWQARDAVGVDGVGWSRYPVRAVDGNLDLTTSGNQSEFVEGFFMMNKNLKEAAAGAR